MLLSKLYARALTQALEGKKEKEEEILLDNFFALLSRRGHRSLLPSIVVALKNLQETKAKKGVAILTLARESDSKHFDTDIQKALTVIAPNEKPRVLIEDSLIGGFRLEKGTALFDESYKKKLLDLYRRIIA